MKVAAALLGLCLGVVTWCSAQTYTNPVYPYDFLDPSALPEYGGYYDFLTNVGAVSIPTLRPDTLASWTWLGGHA